MMAMNYIYKSNALMTVSSAIGDINLQPSFGFTSLNDAVSTLLPVVYFFGGLAAFFYLLLGALKYIVAGSDEAKIKGARSTMMNAIVGLMLLGLTMVIFQVLADIIPGLDSLYFG